jgi:lipopolysaccharide export system protein LptA
VVAAGALLVVAAAATAQTAAGPEPASPENERIRITAQRFEADMQTRGSEFSGNVEATQGDTVIRADRLQVFYNKTEGGDAPTDQLQGQISKIVALGNVRIKSGERTAEAARAEYKTATGVLELFGPHAMVKTGNNSIAGSKITLYRNDARIQVEGGDSRVEAVFETGAKMLQ